MAKRCVQLHLRVSSKQDNRCLSLLGGLPTRQVDTWPIIQRLFEQRTRVVVPKIEGKKSGGMAMVLAPSAQSLADLPLDKWNIPIPDESWSSELAGIDLGKPPFFCLGDLQHTIRSATSFLILSQCSCRVSPSIRNVIGLGTARGEWLQDAVKSDSVRYCV